MRYLEVELGEVEELLEKLEDKVSHLPIRIRKPLREPLRSFRIIFEEVCEEFLSEDDEE